MDVTVTWDKTNTGTPTNYLVVWNYNGGDLSPVSVPVTAQQDVDGYSLDFATSQPSTPLKPGDTVGATVQAYDGLNNLGGPTTPSTPATITLPVTPIAPGAPQNVVLAIS